MYNPDELDNVLKRLQDEINDLRSGPFRIPVVNNDLPVGENTNMWMMSDGRIRWRDVANNNVVREFQQYARIPTLASDPGVASGINAWITSGGQLAIRVSGTLVYYFNSASNSAAAAYTPPAATSTTPVAPAYVPTSRVYEQDASWSTSYRLGGAAVSGTAGAHLYYGRYSATNQEQMSMIGFPGDGNLSGGVINRCQFRLSNAFTYYNGGATLRVGVHNQGASPGSFIETVYDAFEMHVDKPSYDQWVDIPNWIGEGFRDGTIGGLTLHQNTSDIAFYGYAFGVGDSASPPRFHIEYTK